MTFRPNSVVPIGRHRNGKVNKIVSEDEAYKKLANAIVIQAVDDWRTRCKKKEMKNKEENDSFKALRQFFKSEWCERLCGSVDPLYLLRELEAEREAAVKD